MIEKHAPILQGCKGCYRLSRFGWWRSAPNETRCGHKQASKPGSADADVSPLVLRRRAESFLRVADTTRRRDWAFGYRMVAGMVEAVAGESRRLAAGRKPVGEGDSGSAIEVSVIVSTYNAREVLADCLTSIYQHPPTALYEILVVDDASEDETSEMVQSRFPEVRLWRNAVNQHYTRSNNLALRNARGKYIHLLNNDTIVLPDAIDRMHAFLREHPEAGAVGSKLLNDDGTI